jgi:O-antigen ligase
LAVYIVASWQTQALELAKPLRAYLFPASVVAFVAFVVSHTVSLYASSAMTLLALALGSGLLLNQSKVRLQIEKNTLILSSVFLMSFLAVRLPIESPVNDVNSILQWIALAVAAYFLVQMDPSVIPAGYGLAGLYLIATTIPLLFVNLEQAFFNDFEGLSGWFHDNNQFGQVLGLMVVVAVGALLSRTSGRNLKAFHGLVLPVVAVPLILTNSLTAIGAASVAIAVVILSKLMSRSSYLSGARAGFLSLVSVFGAIVIVNFAGFFELFGRGETFTGRTSIWSGLVPLMPKYFWGGDFWDTPDAEALRMSIEFDAQTAHNSFLEIYFSAGAIVFALLLALFFVGFYGGFQKLRDVKADNTYLLMLVYVFTHSLFESSLMSSYLWFAMFVAIFGVRTKG